MAISIFRVIILFCFFGLTMSASNMMIFWGNTSTAPENSNKINVSNWNDCVSQCYNDPKCIIAHSKSKLSTTECYIYTIGEVERVQIDITEATDGQIVALKKNDTDQCPAQNMAFPISGLTPDGDFVASLNENISTVEYEYRTYRCEDGWGRFERIKGTVCLKVFPEKVLVRDEAESSCNAVNGRLAGLENQNESEWIHAQAAPFSPSIFNESFIWLGAQRKETCLGPVTYPKSCHPLTNESFYWTDPSVTGLDGMAPWWNPDGPNNSFGNQSCLEFTVGTAESEKNMTLDDFQCTVNNETINNMMGYVCSKDFGLVPLK